MTELPDGYDAMSNDAQAAHQAFMDSDELSYYDHDADDEGDTFPTCYACGSTVSGELEVCWMCGADIDSNGDLREIEE